MELKSYLISLGFTEKQIGKVMELCGVRNTQLFQKRVEEYKEIFNITNKELVALVCRFPNAIGKHVFSDESTSVQNKIKMIKEIFDLSENKSKKMILRDPVILGYKEASVKARILDYCNILGISESQAKHLITNYPQMLALDTTSEDNAKSVKAKIKELSKIFKISEKQVIKMVVKSPIIICLDVASLKIKLVNYADILNTTPEVVAKMFLKSSRLFHYDTQSDTPTAVKSKIKEYSQIFNMPEDLLKKTIIRCPKLLDLDVISQSDTSVKTKIEQLKNMLGVTQKDVVQIILNQPTVLQMDIIGDSSTSVKTKVKYLKEITTTEQIVDNPMLLMIPSLRLKTRYLILTSVFTPKYVTSCKDLIMSEQILWARKCFLKDNNYNQRHVIVGTSIFDRLYDKDADLLVEQYPLTNQDIKQLEKEHENKYKKSLTLDNQELEAVLGK